MKHYDVPNELQPLSPWQYFGLSILFAIPVVGFILTIVFSLSNDNINRRNFARSYFCGLLLVLIIITILAMAGVAGAVYAALVSVLR